MNIKNIINSSDTKVDSMVKLQGTNYDRRRKVTKSIKHRMEQMYNAGKSYYKIAEHFGVDPRTVRYNLDENYRQSDIYGRVMRAKKNNKKHNSTKDSNRITLADRAEYKRNLMQNKNFRRNVVFG